MVKTIVPGEQLSPGTKMAQMLIIANAPYDHREIISASRAKEGQYVAHLERLKSLYFLKLLRRSQEATKTMNHGHPARSAWNPILPWLKKSK